MSENATRHKQSAPDAPSLEADIEARLAALGPEVEVLLIELTRVQGSPAVRVFLDRPGGVDHALCAKATDCLRDLLREYAVEVSSPGPARPLTKPEHYRRFVGRKVHVRMSEPIEGRPELKGELLGADEHGVVLAGDWGTITIPYQHVRRSNLVPEPIEVPRRQ
jgi:ribosome maturation factor RimP